MKIRSCGLSLLVFGGLAAAGDAEAAKCERAGNISICPKQKKSADIGQGKKEEKDLALAEENLRKNPNDRMTHFQWVRGLMKAGNYPRALQAAQNWRKKDAYNLVVVRLLGDIYSELGQHDKAMRVYSSVVELLPEDPKAHRSLSSVLKQQGQLAEARKRLEIATELRPKDTRMRYEYADVLHRMGNRKEAQKLFESIAVSEDAPKLVRYPARQRLAQLYLKQKAEAKGDTESIDSKLDSLKLESGFQNDIKVYLSWDTDRSDVDLWVVNPKGEKVFYSHKKGSLGGELFGDVTSGYGPESFTASKASPGEYKVQVNYYDIGSKNFPEARGDVQIVSNEGRSNQKTMVIPYRLEKKGQTVTVATILVKDNDNVAQ